MENDIWTRLANFLRASYTNRFKENMAGITMGYVSSRTFLFNAVPPELMHTWLGVWIWMKTVFFAFTSGLATSYAAYLIEKHKEKKSPPTNGSLRKKRNRAA